MNKKGFTLIELLAVIVILGVIMAIAIPAMTEYIDNSRKDSMVSSASQYLDAAINYVTINNALPVVNSKVYVKISDLEIQKGGMSPYTSELFWNRASATVTANGDADITVSSQATESYVLIENAAGTYNYYIYLTDGENCLAATEAEISGTTQTKRGLVLTGTEYTGCQSKAAFTSLKGKDADNNDVIVASRVQ